MKFKCLILDHDDTVVASGVNIHYPAFCETIKTLRPQASVISYQEFSNYCFTVGFERLCLDVYQFNEEEMAIEYAIWKKFTSQSIPPIFPGIDTLLQEFRQKDGFIAVVSHSEKPEIIRDYKHHFGFEPDLVYGWEQPVAMRKPFTGPCEEILKILNLAPHECLMIDDMRLGLEMAKGCQVPFAAAGWSIFDQKVIEYFKSEADFYFYQVQDVADYIFK